MWGGWGSLAATGSYSLLAPTTRYSPPRLASLAPPRPPTHLLVNHGSVEINRGHLLPYALESSLHAQLGHVGANETMRLAGESVKVNGWGETHVTGLDLKNLLAALVGVGVWGGG